MNIKDDIKYKTTYIEAIIDLLIEKEPDNEHYKNIKKIYVE